MAKLRDAPVVVEDLQEYLATQDDFALELYVYSTARALGMRASHGGTYEDPVTKKSRQYDIRAFAGGGAWTIALPIECKSLRKSFPLLVSRIGRLPEESFHQFIYSYERPRNYVYGSSSVEPSAVAVKVYESFYPAHAYVGKSTVQVGRSEKGELISGDSEAFDKWAQAFASADDLIREAFYAHLDIPGDANHWTAILPILVVSDETLWVADYSDDGVLQRPPQQADEVLLYVGREYGAMIGPATTLTHLHICTKRGVRLFLEDVAKNKSLWNRIFPEDAMARGRAASEN